MASKDRNQSQFPDRGPAVVRMHGSEGLKHRLESLVSALERKRQARQARQVQAKPPRQFTPRKTNASPKPARKNSGGRFFRNLLLAGFIIYLFNHFEELQPLLNQLMSEFERFLSGDGERMVDEIMRNLNR